MDETTCDYCPTDWDCECSYCDGSRACDCKPCGCYFDNY